MNSQGAQRSQGGKQLAFCDVLFANTESTDLKVGKYHFSLKIGKYRFSTIVFKNKYKLRKVFF